MPVKNWKRNRWNLTVDCDSRAMQRWIAGKVLSLKRQWRRKRKDTLNRKVILAK